MPVVESPYWDSWPAPSPGDAPEINFVLMKIDPVASVAIFEDAETTRAAAALERHEWVLGFVTGLPPGLPDADGKESMSLRLELVGQGPPKDKPIASLPFAPSPQLYDDRPPIELQPRLPWPDLYLHTYYPSSVLISRIHHGPGHFQVIMNHEEYAPIASRAFNDRVNWKKLPPVTVEKEGEAIPTVEWTGSSIPSDSIDSGSSGDEDEVSLYAQQREDMGMKLLKARIYAEISLDPATCPGPLGCPADLVEPVARIRELWTCWQERMTTEMLAKRPATSAWIQGVEAARHGLESEPNIPDIVEVPLDDIAVLPGDAVDERYEQVRSAERARRLSTPTPIPAILPGPEPPSRPAAKETPSSSGWPSHPLQHSSPGDGDAKFDTSAPATHVLGPATGDPSPGSAPPLPRAPETTAPVIPAPSPQRGSISVVQRVLQFSRRVKPAVVRVRVGLQRLMRTRSKAHAATHE